MSDTPAALTVGDLAAFRTRFGGCELVALLEIATGTVLAWDGAIKVPQERLDGLCLLAARIFLNRPPVLDRATLLHPAGQRIFVRLPACPSEVLCAVMPRDAAVDQMIPAGLAMLARDVRHA